MSFEAVLYEVRENIATITVKRPDKRNASNHALLRDLDVAFEQAENDSEVKVVILKGASKTSCSGYDLIGSPYVSIPEGYDRWTIGNTLKTLRGISARYLRIFNFPKPTIAQIHGYCLVGGCYLQMCCDVAIAAEDAILGHPATWAGGAASIPLWATYLGLRKAKELLFTSRLISGKEAKRIGLVNKAVPADKLEKEAWKMAKETAEVPADGMMILKETLNIHTLMLNPDAGFAYHRQLNAMRWLGRSDGSAPYTLDQLRSCIRGEKAGQ